MKAINRISRIFKIPFRVVYNISSIPGKVVYNKRKKKIKKIEISSPSNIKKITVKIIECGKKLFVTITLILSIVTSSGVINKEVEYKQTFSSSETPIERVMAISTGGDLIHPWTPGAKYPGSNSTSSHFHFNSEKDPRRFFVRPGNLRSNTNPAKIYRKSLSTIQEQINKGPSKKTKIRIKSITQTDDDGNIKKTYFDTNDTVTNNTFATDDTVTNQPSQRLSKNESKLTQVRQGPSVVEKEENPFITDEGDYIHPDKLSKKGQVYMKKTIERRTGPLVKSKFESEDKEFKPVYSMKQLERKGEIRDHTYQVLLEQGKNANSYNKLTYSKKRQIDMAIVENLLSHPDTTVDNNAIGQGREPIAVALNRGETGYVPENHIATFERRPEISDFNSYITNYVLRPDQLAEYDNSLNLTVNFEDLFGQPQKNIGPILGEPVTTEAPTEAPTIDENNSAEL